MGLTPLRRRLLAVLSAALPIVGGTASMAAADTIGAANHGTRQCAYQSVLIDNQYPAPAGGTVDSFSYATGDGNPGDKLAFLVLRPQGGDTYLVVGSSGEVTLTSSSGIQTFAVDPITIVSGDILGFWVGATDGGLDGCGDLGSQSGGGSAGTTPPTTGSAIDESSPGLASNLNVAANFTPTTAVRPSVARTALHRNLVKLKVECGTTDCTSITARAARYPHAPKAFGLGSGDARTITLTRRHKLRGHHTIRIAVTFTLADGTTDVRHLKVRL